MIEIYTDGAVSGNGTANSPGSAAFVVLKDGEKIYQEVYSHSHATNQMMELFAIATACEYMARVHKGKNVTIYSDSAYAINCYKQNWWRNWQKNGWRNAKKQPVANKELWERIIPFFQNENFSFQKVKGHSADDTSAAYWNNYVDKLAVSGKYYASTM